MFADGILVAPHGAPLDAPFPLQPHRGIEVYRHPWKLPRSLLPEALSTFGGAGVTWTHAA